MQCITNDARILNNCTKSVIIMNSDSSNIFQISGMRTICSDEELVPMLCEKLVKACKEADEQQCELAMFRVCSLLICMKGRNIITFTVNIGCQGL